MSFDNFLDAIRVAFDRGDDLLGEAWMKVADSRTPYDPDCPAALSASAYLAVHG